MRGLEICRGIAFWSSEETPDLGDANPGEVKSSTSEVSNDAIKLLVAS